MGLENKAKEDLPSTDKSASVWSDLLKTEIMPWMRTQCAGVSASRGRQAQTLGFTPSSQAINMASAPAHTSTASFQQTPFSSILQYREDEARPKISWPAVEK